MSNWKYGWRRTICRMCVATAAIVLCCSAAYMTMHLVTIIRGRGGRGDFLPFIGIAASLICAASFLCARGLKWTMENSVIAILPVIFILWVLCAWIVQDGTIAYLVNLSWVRSLFDRTVCSWWFGVSFLVAGPWLLGALLGNLGSQRRNSLARSKAKGNGEGVGP